MELIKIIGILIFVIAFGIHLYACAYHIEKLRKISKFFIMPALAILAICYGCKNYLIYLAILFGTLGDILLIDKKKVLFIIGVCCFFLNHLTYIAIMTTIFGSAIKWYFYLAAAIVYLIIAIPCIFIFRKHISKDFGPAGAFYMPIILIELGFGIITSNITVGMCSLPIVGSILFLISDSWLSYVHFVKPRMKLSFSSKPNQEDKDYDDLIIMSTYGIAQYCFIFGFLLFL